MPAIPQQLARHLALVALLGTGQIGASETTEPTPALDPAAALAQAYTACLNAIVVDATPIATKRQAIATQCEDEKQAIRALFPEEVQDLVMLNLDRRLEATLAALEEMAFAIDTVIDDGQQLTATLKANAEEAENDATTTSD
ncbi:MAG: hypothetical protein GDA55_05355 [Cellvibrionales bacterium]|nr:hypothetical protein [Cellvibrionales bacterium]